MNQAEVKGGFIRLHLSLPFHYIGSEQAEKHINADEVVWIQIDKILMIAASNGKTQIILDKNEIRVCEVPEIVIDLLGKQNYKVKY